MNSVTTESRVWPSTGYSHVPYWLYTDQATFDREMELSNAFGQRFVRPQKLGRAVGSNTLLGIVPK